MSFTTTIRFGAMGLLGEFLTEQGDWNPMDSCLVRSERGLELGVILRRAEPLSFALDGGALAGEILRAATPADLRNWNRIVDTVLGEEEALALECLAETGLPLDLAGVEHTLLGDLLLVYVEGPTSTDVTGFARALQSRLPGGNRHVEVRFVGEDLPAGDGCGRPDCPRSKGQKRRCDE